MYVIWQWKKAFIYSFIYLLTLNGWPLKLGHTTKKAWLKPKRTPVCEWVRFNHFSSVLSIYLDYGQCYWGLVGSHSSKNDKYLIQTKLHAIIVTTSLFAYLAIKPLPTYYLHDVKAKLKFANPCDTNNLVMSEVVDKEPIMCHMFIIVAWGCAHQDKNTWPK